MAKEKLAQHNLTTSGDSFRMTETRVPDYLQKAISDSYKKGKEDAGSGDRRDAGEKKK